MTWVATAIIGGALIGGLASNKAANTAAGAANNATNMQQGMFNTIQQQNQPFIQQGQNAIGQLGNWMNDPNGGMHQFNNTDLTSTLAPNYAFQLAQGQQALDRQAGAMGGQGGTGNFETGLQNFTQNTAQNAYQNAFNNWNTQQGNIYNRLSGIATLGSNASNMTGTAGTTLAGNAGQSTIAAGQAGAAGTIGMGNAISSGITGGSLFNYLNPGASGDAQQAAYNNSNANTSGQWAANGPGE
jgi:hypothetical protein